MSTATLWIADVPIAKVSFPVWGGTAELLLTDPGAIDAAARSLAVELAAVGAACSRFLPDSELSVVNARAGRPVAVSPLFLDFLAVALKAASVSAGAVDPTCGSALVALGYDRDYGLLRQGRARASVLRPVAGWRVVEVDAGRGTVRVPDGVLLDFGATAKARAADRAAHRLAAEFGCGVMVNLSGDIAIAGPAPAGGWPVRAADGELTGPGDPGQTIAVFDGGVATSGTTTRKWRQGDRSVHHIVVPETGDAAPVYWQTASAVAATCVDANTLTTTAIVRGAQALPFLAGTGCPTRLVGADGTIALLGGWPMDEESAR
ncbi:thiamine biosynthesis lipoprotein [Catenulispora sp. GP43]|uniref:FAD:protein FMN transferase n=1 Tax=Catenulispora sp. GP43 TaxID=3156263 RepID=UPI0035166E83